MQYDELSMKKDESKAESLFVPGIIIGMLIGFIIGLALFLSLGRAEGKRVAEDEWRQMLVDQGHAVWEIDTQGERTWRLYTIEELLPKSLPAYTPANLLEPSE